MFQMTQQNFTVIVRELQEMLAFKDKIADVLKKVQEREAAVTVLQQFTARFVPLKLVHNTPSFSISTFCWFPIGNQKTLAKCCCLSLYCWCPMGIQQPSAKCQVLLNQYVRVRGRGPACCSCCGECRLLLLVAECLWLRLCLWFSLAKYAALMYVRRMHRRENLGS